MKKAKRLLALMMTFCMIAGMLSGITLTANAAVTKPNTTYSNMVIGILNDSSTIPPDAFPNEPGITGLTYYYLEYNVRNGETNFSLNNTYNGSNFSSDADVFINEDQFWNKDDRIVANQAGNAFGYYNASGLALDDPLFMEGFDEFIDEDAIIAVWKQRAGIPASDTSTYKLLFYVIKYEQSSWGSRYSGYHLDAKVVKEDDVVLSYDANKPEGVTADIQLPVSHSVEPNTDVAIEDLEIAYKNQTANGLNYRFVGWNTQADGSGTPYAAGSTIKVTEDTILYAQWDITNKYEVRWVNHNDMLLESTGHELSYGDPVPTYSGETPTRSDDGTYKYTFSHWELVEGPDDEPMVITEDLTYKAVYTSSRITHKATVQVVLNGTFDAEGNPNTSAPGTLMDISDLTGAENAIYIKAIDTDYIKLEKESIGVYSNAAVGNGSYLIYKKEGGDYIQVGTQALIINNANRTRHLPYYSVEYKKDDTGEIFRTEYYYIGSEVDVITEVPDNPGWIFKHWLDSDGTKYNPSTALQVTDITDSIVKEYVLTAQWDAAKKVSVKVVANHNGRHENPTDDLTLHLTKDDGTGNYNQVAGTTKTIPASVWFNNSDLTETTYDAGIVYEELAVGEYGAHAAIPGYRSNTERTGGAIAINYESATDTYAVTLYLIYDPDGYELEFAVEVDPNIDSRFVPQAVDVKVTRFDADDDDWKVIPQHEYQSVEVAIDPDTRRGTGKVHVWGFNGADPYLYRIEVVRVDLGTYQIDMNTSTDLINYSSKESGFFPAGAYTAEVTVDSHLDDGNGLKGAHADKSGEELEHHGSIVALVTAEPYTISLDPKGGRWGDNSNSPKTIEERFTVPDLADYKPTKEGSTFAGWRVKGTDTLAKEGDAIKKFGIEAGGTLELEAVWNENLTVTGTVVVDLGYPCDDNSRQVRVVLQRREGTGSYYVTAKEQDITLLPENGTTVAMGTYTFSNVPNLDTYHYRISILVAGGGTVRYQNEPESKVAANLKDKSKYNENDFVAELDGDFEAVINVYMEAEPFNLAYMADTSAIAEGFRPTDLTLDLWHDHHVDGEEEFHQIIPLRDFGTFTDGISAIETVDVPPYHANGRLYDYTISVLNYTIDAMGMTNRHYYHFTDTDGYYPAPFSIRYTGPAEYDATGVVEGGVIYEQDVILKAIFEPNRYAITYELDDGHWAEEADVHTHHTWSRKTEIPTPVRNGYLFDGWTVTPKDTDQTDIYDAENKQILEKAWTDVTFTANWKKDEWKDGEPDAHDEGDGTADEEQVRIIYVSANPAFGTVNKELDVITLGSGSIIAAAEATPVDANHEFVKWTCEDVAIANPENPVLSQEIAGVTGGKTYVFVAEFKAIDDWHDIEDDDEKPDTIPDVQQARVIYRPNTPLGGSVNKSMDIFTFTPAGSNSGTITTSEVVATAKSGYEFNGWKCEELGFATDANMTGLNHEFAATGGQTYEFVAVFTPADNWNEADDTDTPDGTPDMYQAKLIFESADANMGAVAPVVDVVTIGGGVSHGTVKVESVASANSGYRFVKWIHEGTQVGTAAALDYDFAVTGGEEYTFVANFETSGGGGGGGGSISYILTYESNGGTEYDTERHSPGRVVKLDKEPHKDGYVFDGWYADKALTQSIEEVKMTRNTTVYAGWVEDNGTAGNGHDTPGALDGEHHFAYVVGYPDGTVRPNDNIDRAEVTAIFFRLLKEEIREQNLSDQSAFLDVTQEDWFNKAIATMAKLGIVKGRYADLFEPTDYITRAEFAAICARFDDSEFEIVDEFTDVAGHWAEDEIHEAAAHGWIKGYEDGTFKPDQLITRAEAMTMINRVLNRVPETKDDLHEDMTLWPDNADPEAWYYLPVQEATNSHKYEMKNHIYESWTALTENTDWTIYQ